VKFFSRSFIGFGYCFLSYFIISLIIIPDILSRMLFSTQGLSFVLILKKLSKKSLIIYFV